MYTKNLRNPDGTFRATKVLIEKGLKAPVRVKIVLLTAAASVAVWETSKLLFKLIPKTENHK